MTLPSGWILDEFDSPIDGKPCVAIMINKSGNTKTGNMMQVHILRRDVNPVAAVTCGDDYSICGDCKHRKNQITGKKTCYVNVGQGPNSVWQKYKRGGYADDMKWNDRDRILKGRKIRWGAYGDPAILRPDLVDVLNFYALGWTGYTHQWRQDFAQPFSEIFQASVDNHKEYFEAKKLGWRTYFVAEKPDKGQTCKPEGVGIQCPESREDLKTNCLTCSLCNGHTQDIWIEVHGTGCGSFKNAV